MPRPLREDFAGAIHHVFARGNRRQPIFHADEDCALYLALLAGVVVAKKWRLLAYCLMPNHVHLVLETPEANLARGMQCLHGLYGRIFNDRYGLVGHLFESRYGSKVIRDDGYLLTAVRYVALNPIEAGLANDPCHWRWSSFGGVVDDSAPSWLDRQRLLAYLADWGGDPVERYRSIVTDALRAPA